MTEINNAKRNLEIDILRGIGIIIVVALHVGLPSIFWSNFFGAFHMAIFIFCSGYCFNAKSLQCNPLKYCLKKVKTLYVPYVLFNTVLILLTNFFIKYNIYTDNQEFLAAQIGIANFFGLKYKMDLSTTLKEIGFILLFGKKGEPQLAGATWFLRVLFVITVTFYVIQYLIKRLFKEKYEAAARWIQMSISAIFLLVGWQGHVQGWENKYLLFSCCSIYFIYVAGWLLAQTDIFQKMDNIYIAILTIIICFLILKVVTPEALIGINANTYSSVAHLIIASLAGVVLFFVISIQIKKIKILKNIFSELGKESLYIMMFHFLALKIVTLFQVIYYDYPSYYLAAFPVLYPNGLWRILYIFTGCFVSAIIGWGFINIKNKVSAK